MYTILHLEQSGFIKKLVKNILLENGFNCISVDTADEAYETLHNLNGEVDLIITSLLLEDTSIEQFMKTINGSDVNRNIPVFVVTGNELENTKKRILNLGVSDYITKNNLGEELLKHIKYIVKEDELLTCLKEAKIACIDDSHFDRAIMKDILTKYDIKNVDFYSSGKDLTEYNKRYDLYLVDIVLENEFGKNIIIRLRRDNINSSIIITSSLTNTKTVASMLNAGANDYIRKPLQEDIFMAKLKSNMRTYALMKQLKK
ncbi:response regulator [Clostridium sp. P21]|uniref:Stage 0 sporulation protein A homolog n=1 Tax=Clostridium muellerianum TaxID=2716538 RepID=A0A7Y0EKP3_9CLOT|nr:response regulator [Clostridium muellerianum]NMM65259.1 response regulator [Clostridium muellerianum]